MLSSLIKSAKQKQQSKQSLIKKNMLQSCDPIHILMSFQHQSNHYKNIVNPRKTYTYFSKNLSGQEDNNKKTLSIHLNNKFYKQKQNQIICENKRMYKDFIQIQKRQGILSKAEYNFRSLQSQQTRKSSLINPFRAKQQTQRIRKQNASLKKKISCLKPIIGEKESWKKHQQFNDQMVNKLRNKTADRKRYFTGQNILKLVIKSSKEKGQGGLKLFQTLRTEFKQQLSQKPIQCNTARSGKRRKSRKQNKNEINQDQNPETENLYKYLQKYTQEEKRDGVIQSQDITQKL